MVLELRADGTRLFDICCFLVSRSFFFLNAAKYNRHVVRFLNVKRCVVLPFSIRWQKWTSTQALRQQCLFKLDLALA